MDGYRVEDAADLGQLIRRVRKAQGFTQQELADGSGVGITLAKGARNSTRSFGSLRCWASIFSPV